MPRKKRKVTTPKRVSPITTAERALVRHVVADSPREISREQTDALAVALRRNPETVKRMVEEAREEFVSTAKTYVEIHKDVVQRAAASEDPKALEVARKGAAWALTNISHEGKRVVDKPDSGPSGTKVYVGISMGGLKGQAAGLVELPAAPVDVEVVPA